MKNSILYLSICFAVIVLTSCKGDTISNSFEMRYFTHDPNADGETDFKGPTEVFDTDQRVEFLRHYADFAKKFFNDPYLDTPAATDEEAQQAMARIKPQPLPEVRTTMKLTDWRYLGYRSGQDREEAIFINELEQVPGISVLDGRLVMTGDPATWTRAIEPELTWRLTMEWTAGIYGETGHGAFSLSEKGADKQIHHLYMAGFDSGGEFFYVSQGEKIPAGKWEPDSLYRFRMEVDMDPMSRRYNLYINDSLVADFVPLSDDGSDDGAVISQLVIKGSKGLEVDDIWGLAYEKTSELEETGKAQVPFHINPFIAENFSVRPSPEGFEMPSYDDSDWQTVPRWPYAHGGDLHRGEHLYLRTTVMIDEFERAVLNLEKVQPSGAVYVNGRLVKEVGIYPETLDVTGYLDPGSKNTIAVRVDPYQVNLWMNHTNSGGHTGWFAGHMELELTEATYIDDLFASTLSTDDPAMLRLELAMESAADFEGEISVELYPWHPQESDQAVVREQFPVRIAGNTHELLTKDISVADPDLWTTETPNLYKVHVVLYDLQGRAIDDKVITTGLRTVSQEGGTFRINGKPEMLLGPLLFQYLHPMERNSQFIFCPPKEWIVKQIVMVKNLTGNTIRLSIHDSRVGGVNDRRFAEIGDQLGIMYMWQTSGWVRTDDLRRLDLENLPLDVKAVRNHPSIVMWQPANHPTNLQMDLFEKVFQTVVEVDQSRLVSPTAKLRWLAPGHEFEREGRYPGNGDQTWPSWTHPLVARGEMEQTTGYSHDWEQLRLLPENPDGWKRNGDDFGKARQEYLNSQTHAFFDFENEESIGQPNWEIYRGKPMYKIHSYERDYAVGSIGRVLDFDEWQEHQAYQAFSAYEAYRKKRWLGYDALNWCNLRGGPNTGTYMKPLVGYYDRSKLAYHTVRMAFQRVLAGSGNVDVVYGPNDEIPVVIENLGDERTVSLEVIAWHTESDKVVDRTRYRNVSLDGGKSVTQLPAWKPSLDEEGFYVFEYIIYEN